MTFYVLQRLASIVVVLVLISMIIFVAIHVLPGSAATLILGEYATPAALETLEREMGSPARVARTRPWRSDTVSAQPR